MKRISKSQAAAVGFAMSLFAAGATGSAYAEDVVEDGAVELNVEITDRDPGMLALSVASGESTLVEVDSGDPTVREFTGTLPEVTVIDTRTTAPETPWYVLGTASDFVSAEDVITADHLGWAPTLLDDYGPLVEPGGDIPTAVDDPDSEGLSYADGELLYANYDEHAQGAWAATADLHLKVDATSAAAGSYSSILTLSLFE